MKIKTFEKLASEMVGDDKGPNVYFVSREPLGVVLVTRDWDTAYNFWKDLPRNVETCLEDRLTGVICDTSPDENGKLRTYDDSNQRTR